MKPELNQRSTLPYVAVRRTLRMDELGDVLPECWPQVFNWVSTRGLVDQVTARPIIRYLKINMPDELVVDIGIPLNSSVQADGDIVADELPAGNYAEGVHEGPYDLLADANAALQSWAAAEGIELDGEDGAAGWSGRFEMYLTDPETTPDPSGWQTLISYRVKDQ